MTFEQITLEALKLPAHVRAELADRLIESLDCVELSEIDRLWASEARRRADEIIEGKVETIPADVVFSELRRSSRS